MSYRGKRRATGRPPIIEGEIVATAPAPRRIGRWAFAWAWLRARFEVRRADRATALAARDPQIRPGGYVGGHGRTRRVLAVTVRLDRARRSDVRRPVSVAVVRGGREKAPARHSCPERAPRARTAAVRHHRRRPDTLTVAETLYALQGAGRVGA